jgi:hypothetical protein
MSFCSSYGFGLSTVGTGGQERVDELVVFVVRVRVRQYYDLFNMDLMICTLQHMTYIVEINFLNVSSCQIY